MTKEQFNTFKREFKVAVELRKFNKKYSKGWKKAGYESKEAFDQDYPVRELEREELSKQITKVQYRWGTTYAIHGHEYQTHWAYYCAKHRLSDEEIEKYVNEQYSKLKQPVDCVSWCLRRVQKILEIYGAEAICADEQKS